MVNLPMEHICPFCGYKNPENVHICLNCASSLLIKCTACGNEAPFDSKYCGQCGTPLPKYCPICSAVIPQASKFCGQCGAVLGGTILDSSKSGSQTSLKLSAQDRMLKDLQARMPSAMKSKISLVAPEIAGQRREVTILFLSITNINQASQVLDSEEIYLALDEIVKVAGEIIYTFEGTIDKFTGDGLMALFGMPINHENDPERAVRAALTMLSDINQLKSPIRTSYGFDFNLQIGLNTGPVTVGSLGAEHHVEYTVIGDTVNLAAQLKEHAEPGSILVSFSTFQRTNPIINYLALPPTQLNGIKYPVRAFQCLGIRMKPGQVRGLSGMQVPMVGRDHDFHLLQERLTQVNEIRSGQVILCTGDAGIGKTRLVAEFRKSMAGKPFDVVQGTCASYMRSNPYRVIADVIRSMIHVSELAAEDIQREALQQALEQRGLDQKDILPYILNVLGLSRTDPIVEARLKFLEPAMLQRQTFAALRAFFLSGSGSPMKVFIFDDLHWVDQASSDFLVHFCQTIKGFPILLLLIARDFTRSEITQSLLDNLRNQIEDLVEIHLEPLSVEDSRILVDQLIQETTQQANSIKQIIIERASGNPYYTEEMVRVLIDQHGIIQQDGIWQVTSLAGDLIKEVPGTLQDIILARFDRLSTDLQGILQKSSVIGQFFTISLIQMLSAEDSDSLLNMLNELEARDFLLNTQLGIEEGYIFHHPLLREVVYNTLLKRDLRKLHSKIAECIDAGLYWMPGEKEEYLAYHYAESTEPAKAIPFLIESAEKAARRCANETVIQDSYRALELMEAGVRINPHQYDRVRIMLGQALKLSGQYEEAIKVLEGIVKVFLNDESTIPQEYPEQRLLFVEGLRELADIHSREGALELSVELLQKGLKLIGEGGRENYPIRWRSIIDRIAWVYFRQGKLEEAFHQADLALQNVHPWESDDPIVIASLYNTQGGIYWMRSRNQDAIASVEQSLKIYQEMNYFWGMAISYTNLGVLQHSLGNWSEAVRNLEQADLLRKENGYNSERPTELKNLGEVLICMGEHGQAREKLETSRDISRQLKMTIYAAYAELGLCRLSIIENKLEEARAHLEAARSLLDPLVDEVDDRNAQLLVLDALIKAKDKNYQAGLDLAHKGCDIAERGGFSAEKVEALRVLGVIYTAMEMYEKAEENFASAVERARGQGDQYSQAQALFDLSKMRFARSSLDPASKEGGAAQALSELSEAINIFETLGAKYDLRLAQLMRNQIVSKTSHPKTVTTAEESQVQESQLRKRLGLPEGEWYQATILIVQIEPQPEADPEFVLETIALLLPPMIEIIKETEGEFIRHRDSMTIVFGAPRAHEDDPERAIETAIKINNFYKQLYDQTHLLVDLRLGITMGKVVAGRHILEPGSEAEFMVAGKPIQEARNLVQAAPFTKIWVSQSVRNATAYQYDFSLIPSGFTSNISENAIYQLEGIREQIRPIRGLIGLKTHFIGRQAEINAIRTLSQNLMSGIGGLVWIEGEAGIGKSRLMREVGQEAADRGALLLQGTCFARSSEYTFSLFSNLLSKLFDFEPTFPPEQIYRLIDQKLQGLPEESIEIRPVLQLLSGVQPVGTPGEQLTNLEPEQFRRQIFVSFRRFVAMFASKQPVVLLLDDLQWVDMLSAELLLFLTNLIISYPVLIIGARRSGEKNTSEKILEQTRHMHPEKSIHILVRPLTTNECDSLLDEFFASSDIPDTLRNLIVQQSGGNPYYIEEFIRLLIEQDYLTLKKGRLIINQKLEFDSLKIPPSLETLIRARVDALPGHPRRLLQVASIIGQRFSLDMLSQVSSQVDVGKNVETLQLRGMLNPAAEADYWEFSHPLIEIVVYNTVLKVQRKILHSQTARALEVQWKGVEVEHAEELAYHFNKAEEYNKALLYVILAGERAATRHANETAIRYFTQAQELLNLLPGVSDLLRWRITCGYGEVNQFIGNFDTAIEFLEAGLTLTESTQLTRAQRAALFRILGDTYLKKGEQETAITYLKKALEVLGDPSEGQSEAEAARILSRMGWSYFYMAKLDLALEVALDALLHAQKAQSLSSLAMVENLLGGIFFRQGDLKEAVKHTQQARSYWEDLSYGWGVAAALSNLGVLEGSAGEWASAYEFFQKSLELRQEMGDVEGVAIAYNNLGTLARDRGDLETAETHFRNCLAIARPFQLGWHIVNASIGLAQVLLYQEKVSMAADIIQGNLALAEELQARDLLSEMIFVKAEIQLAQGSYDEAIQSAKQAANIAAEVGNRAVEASSRRVETESLRRQGKIKEALQALSKAWGALPEGTDELETGRLHAEAVAICLSSGEHEKASTHTQKAREIFNHFGAMRDLAQLDKINNF